MCGGRFFILYNADKVMADEVRCDIIVNDQPVTNIREVQTFMNEHQFLHIVNMKEKDILLNTWNVLKVKYYEKQ